MAEHVQHVSSRLSVLFPRLWIRHAPSDSSHIDSLNYGHCKHARITRASRCDQPLAHMHSRCLGPSDHRREMFATSKPSLSRPAERQPGLASYNRTRSVGAVVKPIPAVAFHDAQTTRPISSPNIPSQPPLRLLRLANQTRTGFLVHQSLAVPSGRRRPARWMVIRAENFKMKLSKAKHMGRLWFRR